MRRWLAILIVILMALTAIPVYWNLIRPFPLITSKPNGIPPTLTIRPTQIRVGSELVEVEIARTPQTQEKGLSGQKVLNSNQGMLFIFDRADAYQFWMKDMLLPIDIIWMNASEVVDISAGLTPESFPKTYSPKVPVRFVLEVPANWAFEHNIIVGTKVNLGNLVNN